MLKAVFSKKMPTFAIQKKTIKTYDYGRKSQNFSKEKLQNYNHF